MKGFIDGVNFQELEPMRYWAPPASWDLDKKKTTVHNRIFSGDWYAAEKKDGYFTKFVKDEDGNCQLLSRSRNVNGEFPNKIGHVPQFQSFFDSLPNGTVFLGEVYFPSNPGSNQVTKILGCLEKKAIDRQEIGEKLHFYIFDVLAYNGTSWLKLKTEYRFHALMGLAAEAYKSEYVEWAQYKTGQELWDMLQNILASGGEGIVLLHKDGLYEPGKRPSKTTMKVKKELRETIDCFFTGRASAPTKEYCGKDIEHWEYWVDVVTDERLPIGEHYFKFDMEHRLIVAVTKPYYNHWAGSLEIALVDTDANNKVVSIGYLSGLPDEIKANYKDYAKRVIEVGAMQITEDGALRHGKMIGWRDDKDWTQCSLLQLRNK